MQIVYLNGARLHLTWHELLAQFRHPLFVGMILALGATIVLIGPYDHLLGFGALRLAIFYASAFSSFTFLLLFALWLCHRNDWPAYSLLTVGFAGLGSTCVGLSVALLLGAPMPSTTDLLLVTGFNLVFSYLGEIVHAAFIMPRIIAELRGLPRHQARAGFLRPDIESARTSVIVTDKAHPPPAISAPPTRPKETVVIFGRQFLSGEIEVIEAEEHYVGISTRDGKMHLVRGRIADAIAAMPEMSGRQVHRSYWIAGDSVQEFRADGGAYFVRLRSGRLVPVARGRAADVRNWCEHLRKAE